MAKIASGDNYLNYRTFKMRTTALVLLDDNFHRRLVLRFMHCLV
jgi:hypothetical protein